MLRRAIVCALVLGVAQIGFTGPARAEVTFGWVTVGNPGNAPDPLNSPGGPCEPDLCISGIGSVPEVYRIAKREVANHQYADFLNAVAATDTNELYNPSMGANPRGGITQSGTAPKLSYAVKQDMGNKPVNYVSFFDAMRFVNWLHNGQPTGAQDASTTEDGVYAISDGFSETRAAVAKYFIPTDNEWYKAAYHQPSALGGDSDDYWLYPTSSNSVPTAATASDNGDNFDGDINNPGPNVVNYMNGVDWNGLDGNVTTLGSAGTGSDSFYGTSDQGGNVWEWNERVVGGSFRFDRGGAYNSSEFSLRSSFQDDYDLSGNIALGFRVASPAEVAIPTVSTWGVAAMVLVLLVAATVVFRRVRVA